MLINLVVYVSIKPETNKHIISYFKN